MEPILQVTELQPFSSRSWFRFQLSDGSQQLEAVLPHKNNLVKSGKLRIGSVIKLTRLFCNTIQNRRLIIMIDLEVMIEKCDVVIGYLEMLTRTDATNQPGPVRGNPVAKNEALNPYQGRWAINARMTRVGRKKKVAEAKERVFAPPIPSDKQYILKRCEILEKEVRSLKLNLSFMNRKDSVQTEQIEELQKQNQDLVDDKEWLLEEIERILLDSGKI